jgi:pyrroloquinoline quinone biosynthesis protein D
MSETLTITPGIKPVLPRGVRLTENPAQGTVLVAPERVFKADGIAAVILKRCDGSVTIAQMADEPPPTRRRATHPDGHRKAAADPADKRMLDVAP